MTGARSAGRAAPPATRRTDATLLGIVAGLAIYNVARSTVIQGGLDIVMNVAVGAAVLAAGRWSGLWATELGLDRTRLHAGLRLGSIAASIVAAAVIAGAVVLSSSGDVDDDRVDISLPAMLLRVLVIIPIATAVVEEVIFRGVLYGLLRRRLVRWAAFVAGAVLFGLWHVYPAWLDQDGSAVTGIGRWAAVAGTFAATCAAGIVFTWLRERSGHLAAPVLCHTATNSVTFAVAWIAVR